MEKQYLKDKKKLTERKSKADRRTIITEGTVSRDFFKGHSWQGLPNMIQPKDSFKKL
jgi:hypothetical protein